MGISSDSHSLAWAMPDGALVTCWLELEEQNMVSLFCTISNLIRGTKVSPHAPGLFSFLAH